MADENLILDEYCSFYSCQDEIKEEQDEKSTWKCTVRMYAKQHGYTLFESLEDDDAFVLVKYRKGVPVMKHVEWDDVREQFMAARYEENKRLDGW
jgi:hypothetical protein